MNTVFGHLALQFSTHPENLATEALGFILNNSTSASSAFSGFLRARGIECNEIIRFETQRTGADDSRPDIVCWDNKSHIQIVVENKFWAGLTDNQPVAYFKGLSISTPGSVLFVVPEARRSLVWNEVASRCNKEAGLVLGTTDEVLHTTVARTAGGHFLAVTSWKSLLGALLVATSSPDEARAHGDIVQLQGLCETMDNEAFLPLRGDELTNLEIPRRIIDYIGLASDIASEAEVRQFCNRRGVKATSLGTYIRIGGYQPWLGFDYIRWRHSGSSPIWINFFPPPYSPITLAEIRDKLIKLRTDTPKRCFDFKDRIAVPLFLLAGVEKKAVIDHAVDQLGELVRELGIEQHPQSAELVQAEPRNEELPTLNQP
jgi:hypothetical protein